MGEHIQKRQGYSFQLVNIDCLREAVSFNVIMDLERSVSHLMPFIRDDGYITPERS